MRFVYELLWGRWRQCGWSLMGLRFAMSGDILSTRMEMLLAPL